MTGFRGTAPLGRTRLLGRFYREEGGNVAIMFAGALMIMTLGVGAAVDIGRWLHARDQTSSALDSAVLAGARAYHTSNKNATTGIAAAQQFYNQNVLSRLPVVDDTVSFAVNADGKGISANGNAYLKTPFLRLAGISKLPLINVSDTVAEFGSGEAEISLMLDVTGSMAGSKLQSLKNAASKLVTDVLAANAETKIAIVPFSEDIRLPSTSARDKARGTGLKSSFTKSVPTCIGNWCYGNTTKTFKLTDCVVERKGSERYTDVGPGTNKYVMAKYGDNTTSCTIPSNAAVQPLTNQKSTLLDKIDNLSAAGGTAGQLGTAWAWYTLSPNWNSLWGTANQARAYDTDKNSQTYLRKVAVLMTDGEYNTQYASDGTLANQNSINSCPDAVNGCASEQAKQLCEGMKAKGIEVFAIVYGTDQGAIDVMRKCASKDTDQLVYFYNATSGEQLEQAFNDIGIKMTKLYLSK